LSYKKPLNARTCFDPHMNMLCLNKIKVKKVRTAALSKLRKIT